MISSRVKEIEGRYSERIARIIANMLDYDLDERMAPKEFAVWINREIKEYNEEAKEPRK